MNESMKAVKFTKWHGAYNAGTIAGFPASTADWLVKHGKAVFYTEPAVAPKAEAPPPKRATVAEKAVTK